MYCDLWPYVWLINESGFKSRAAYGGARTVFTNLFNLGHFTINVPVKSKERNQSESEELKSRADTFPRIMASFCPSGNGENSGEIIVSVCFKCRGMVSCLCTQQKSRIDKLIKLVPTYLFYFFLPTWFHEKRFTKILTALQYKPLWNINRSEKWGKKNTNRG